MRLSRLIAALIPAAALALAPSASAGVTLYAIGDGGASLLRFNSDDVANATRVASFNGAAGFLDGIDFRPSTGELYGYLDSTDSIYTVDAQSGALTLASVVSAPTNTFVLGIDFNPQVVVNGALTDRLRIVTDSQQNLRANVDTGATVVDGTLTYDANDVNANSPATLIGEAAYLNSDRNIATATKLYYLDYGLDILATTTDPNGGTLTTVGSLGVDTSELMGFDILTSPNGANTAYALLTVGGVAGLYTIDLATGAASLQGEFDSQFGNIYGLAAAPVPEPSTIVLCGVGLAVVGARSIRRKLQRKS